MLKITLDLKGTTKLKMCAFEKCCCLLKVRTGLIIFSSLNLIYGVALLASGGSTFKNELPSIVCIVAGTFLVLEALIVFVGAITRHHIVLLVSLIITTIVLVLLIVVGILSLSAIGSKDCGMHAAVLNRTNITNTDINDASTIANSATIDSDYHEDHENMSNLPTLASFFFLFAIIHGYTICMMYSYYLVLSNTNRGTDSNEMVASN